MISDIESAVKIVAGVVTTVSGSISIAQWIHNLKPNTHSQLRKDLAKIDAANFDGWVQVNQWTPEDLGVIDGEKCMCSSGYIIYVYHDELDELDRIEIREPGPWRADGVDRMRKVLGVDLR